MRFSDGAHELKKNTQYAWSLSTACMGYLKSEWCVNALLKILSDYPEKSLPNSFAKRALSLIGHKETVENILKEADEDRSAMGNSISGGNLYYFSLVPSFKGLEFARERIKNNSFKDGIVLSINTIEGYGDMDDWDSIKEIFEQSWLEKGHYYSKGTFFSSFYCLYGLDKMRSIELIKEKIGEDFKYDLLIYDVLLSLGHNVIDAEKVIKYILNADIINDHSECISVDTAEKMLYRIQLDDKQKNQLKDLLIKQTDEWKKRFIWKLADKNNVYDFDDIAFNVVEGDNLTDIGFAVEYSKSRNWGDEKRIKFNELVKKCFIRWKDKWDSEGLQSLVDYLIDNNNADFVAEFINFKLDELLTAVIYALQSGANTFKGKEILYDGGTLISINFENFLRDYICLAVKIHEKIEKVVVLKLLEIPLLDSWGDAKEKYKVLLKHIDDHSIDQKVYNNNIPHARIWLLSIISDFGITSKRIQILQEELNRGYPWPPYPFRDSIQNLWCEQTFLILIDLICNANWIAGKFHYPDHIIDTVTENITKDLAVKYIKIDDTRKYSDFSQRTLQFWYDIAISQR